MYIPNNLSMNGVSMVYCEWLCIENSCITKDITKF